MVKVKSNKLIKIYAAASALMVGLSLTLYKTDFWQIGVIFNLLGMFFLWGFLEANYERWL